MIRPAPAPDPRSAYARHGPAVIAEKVRVLRVVRGLDRAGIDPSRIAALRTPLVHLAELDQMLTIVLDGLEEVGCGPPAPGEEGMSGAVPELLHLAEATRGDVIDALSPPDRKAFDRAAGEVAVLEAEVWMQVDELRARGPGRRTSRPLVRSAPGSDPAAPLSDDEARRAGDAAWGRGRKPPRPAGRAQVAEAERALLPPADAPLLAWFDRMPAPWLRGVAIVNDIPVSGGEPLAARVATAFSDRAWLERLLAERLGASEREKLAILLGTGPLPLGAATSATSAVFEVGWDWTLGLPAPVGAKLRAIGLVHVGRQGRARVATVPPPLVEPLTALLVAVDPDAADAPARVVRDRRATASEGKPFADPVLARWKAIDKSLGAVFEAWLGNGALSERAVIPFFGPGPRVLETDAQRQGLCEYALFDYRAKPGAATVGERALETTRFASPDHRAIAAATVATRPAIYRIDAVVPGEYVDAVPVFPPGPPVRVTDRAFAHSAPVGIWVPMRVYPAGPFHFFRIVGDPIARAAQPALERALRRGTRGADPAAWIAEDPAAFFRILRANSR